MLITRRTDAADMRRFAERESAPVAAWVGNVLSPVPVLAVTICAVSAMAVPSAVAAAGWALWVATFAVVIPRGALSVQLLRGRVSDRQIVRRSQRLGVLAVSIASLTLGTAISVAAHMPQTLLAFVAAMTAAGLAMAAVSLVWKASFHAGVLAGSAAVLGSLWPPAGVVGVFCVGVVAWSRVAEGRHSTAQVIVGATLSAAVAWAVFHAVLHV